MYNLTTMWKCSIVVNNIFLRENIFGLKIAKCDLKTASLNYKKVINFLARVIIETIGTTPFVNSMFFGVNYYSLSLYSTSGHYSILI